jgi:hypothetical protein
MLIQEAHWFKQQLASLEPAQVFPMCNVGSSTAAFRTRDQPWIEEAIFAPIARQGYVVKHLDAKPAPGVDIIGDLGDPEFRKQISCMEFKSAFCSNLLEHVVQRDAICRTLVSIIPSGGYLFISVPFSFPYHPDPVDTGFRPSVEELAALFVGTRLVRSAIVTGDAFLKLRRRDPIVFALTLIRCLFPFYKPVCWWRNRGYVTWFFRRVSASCVVLRKD